MENLETLENNNSKTWNMEDAPSMAEKEDSSGEKERDIEIAALTHEDIENHSDQIGEALFLVDQYIFPDLFGDEAHAKVLAKELFSDDPNALFSLENTRVAKDSDGNIMGILVFREQDCSPWDTDAVRERFEKTGFGLSENFERANENYMKKITDAELSNGAAEIEFCGVLPEYQGQGIGTKLFDSITNDPKYAEVHLDVLDSHPNARKLYEKLGFEPNGEKFPNYPDGSEGVQHMVLKKQKQN